ncbi:dynein light chain roadblock-type 1-like [Panonychus citri]|uniref:dynein light chain roadblock-type 1-like n=1 Tax=Panonychus citri TaxID=50023 RepID=UPI002307EF9A|nr:dynein light chain roadblock-type 1-like [Panonychus citri]XP_053206243.1 dynein light chain roadblock-type 1-like [Panonychus citri]
MNAEIEETLKRIESTHKSVMGVIVTDDEGNIIKSTLSENKESSESYANIICDIVEKARMALKDKEYMNDELTFLKIRTKRIEFIVVPDKDYILITLLNPTLESTA